jgi:hypothetical protein
MIFLPSLLLSWLSRAAALFTGAGAPTGRGSPLVIPCKPEPEVAAVMKYTCSCKIPRPGMRAFSLVSLLLSALPAQAALTMEQVLRKPYFDAADIEEIQKGGFGVARIHEVSDREIAVAIACLVKGAPDEALAPFLGDSLPVDKKLLQDQSLIDPGSPQRSFEGISLASNEGDEIQHYLDARAGIGLNLSSEEIAMLQALQVTGDAGRVEASLEHMLHARYMSYRNGGLAGTQPYAREKGEDVSPGEELRKTGENMKGLHELYPEFHNAWLTYPRNLPEDLVADDYFWIKLDIDERPAFLLSHRLVSSNEDRILVGIRDYYASHFFDVAQRVAAVTRLKSGEDILIYVERAWVDYWSGFASLSKKIGHKVMKQQMEHLLEDHAICGR